MALGLQEGELVLPGDVSPQVRVVVTTVTIVTMVLPGDVSPQVRVVVAPGCSGLATNAADVRLLPGVHLSQGGANYWGSACFSFVLHLQVIGEIVAPRKLLVTMLAFVVPAFVFVMLAHCTLYIVNCTGSCR